MTELSQSTVSQPVAAETPSRLRALCWELLVPVVLYLIVGFWIAIIHGERMNADGVCYSRLARYLVAGDLPNAISTYWSPLFGWSMAPLLMLGVDSFDAAAVTQVLWGAAALMGFHWFLRSWTDLPSWGRAAAMFLLVLPLSDFATFVVAPDVALAACLLFYFAALGDARWRSSKLGLLGIGVLGGVAYWTKAYALPFVLLHLPITMLCFGFQAPMAQRVRQTGIALLGFALPVGLWICALTWQHGSITIGSSGAINHAVVGPPDVLRYHPVVFGVPSPPHISVWENPEKLPYQYWSPFQSWPYFKYQTRVVRENAAKMVQVLAEFDTLKLSALVALALVPLGWWLWRDSRTRALLWWTAGTIALYLAGYLMVAFEDRYANSLVFPLLLASGLQAILVSTRRLPPWAGPAAVALLAASIAWKWIPITQRNLTLASPPYMRSLAQNFLEMNFHGPFASTSWYHGVALAFSTNQPSVGFPPDASPEVCAERLRAAGVNWIVVWEMPNYPPQPVQDLYPPTIPRAKSIVHDEPGWKLQRAIAVPFGKQEARIYLYQRMNPIAP